MNLDFDPRIDHYKVLGVKSDASQDEIKRAYRNMAKKYHPDSTGGDKAKEARFKKVSQAYDVLGDSDKRAQYDAVRAGGHRFGHGHYGGGGRTRRGAAHGRGPGNTWDLSDLFAQMYQEQGRGQHGPGAGQGPVDFRFGPDFFAGADPTAARAHRQGRSKPAKPAERKVRLRNGGTATVRGHDVYADLRLGFDQVTLGTVAEVVTMAGKSKVKIPPGTSSGVKLRLKGKGARRDDGTRGDHFAVIQIEVPKQIDEEAEKLLVQFMRRVKQSGR